MASRLDLLLCDARSDAFVDVSMRRPVIFFPSCTSRQQSATKSALLVGLTVVRCLSYRVMVASPPDDARNSRFRFVHVRLDSAFYG